MTREELTQRLHDVSEKIVGRLKYCYGQDPDTLETVRWDLLPEEWFDYISEELQIFPETEGKERHFLIGASFETNEGYCYSTIVVSGYVFPTKDGIFNHITSEFNGATKITILSICEHTKEDLDTFFQKE